MNGWRWLTSLTLGFFICEMVLWHPSEGFLWPTCKKEKIEENVAIKEFLTLALKNLPVICYSENSLQWDTCIKGASERRQSFAEVIRMFIEYSMLHFREKMKLIFMFLEWPNTNLTWFAPRRFYCKSMRAYNLCLCPFLLATHLAMTQLPLTEGQTLPSAHRSFTLSEDLLWIHPVFHLGSQNTAFRVHSSSIVAPKEKKHISGFFFLVSDQAQSE